MLQNYYKLVDEAISELGLNPDETHGEQAGQWNLKKGRLDHYHPSNTTGL